VRLPEFPQSNESKKSHSILIANKNDVGSARFAARQTEMPQSPQTHAKKGLGVIC
jgi:hypothetical protein